MQTQMIDLLCLLNLVNICVSASLQYKNVILFKLCTDNHFVDDYARFSTLDTKEKSTAVANSMNYMTKKGEWENRLK